MKSKELSIVLVQEKKEDGGLVSNSMGEFGVMILHA